MSNVTIAWTSTNPLDSDLLSAGAGEIRSERSNLQLGLSQEHFWPEGGGPAGAHRKGSARVFVGTSSQVSSADTDGRLMFNSTLSQLVYLDSTSSTIVGGRRATQAVTIAGGVAVGGTLGSGLTQYIAIDAGVLSNVPSGNVANVVGFNVTFVVPPNISLTVAQTTATPEVYAPYLGVVGTSNFTIYTPGAKNAPSVSTMSIYWQAIGPVAYP